MLSLRFAVPAAMLMAAASLSAQYTVKRMVFQGGAPYTQKQLEAASGLAPGQKIGQKEMSDAAQHIMDSGAFGDIEMSLNGAASGIDVIFKLKPADPATMLPVSFENIAWLTPEEREAGLKQRVPLYADKLPAAGYLQQQVQDALQEMLKAKSVNAKVEGFQKPSTPERPTAAVAFRVTEPRLVLSNVKLAGVSAELAPGERKSIGQLVGTLFNEGIDSHLSDTLLSAYRNAGYVDAKLDNVSRTVADGATGSANVTVAAQVVPGEPYRVASITWPGTALFSADDFAKGNKVHAGDTVSVAALRESYQPILDAYHRQGYVDAAIVPALKADTANHTVAYELTISPGQVYHVDSVHITGLSGQARKDFDANWKLKAGAVWDSIYAEKFLQNNSALRSLDPYTAKFDSVAHPETHTVNVTITFFANNK
ncbi:POTRA domain-containing protein [Terriglobus sp. TAA 43]|uniref:POTRA domain-containing protein n=1 Tax=Terriglobus sp. TAA 43 TaxID=278961 RepID=UPI0006480E48|nr:POTRA domain-containing protein [Terriglobus sp. TAA 43]